MLSFKEAMALVELLRAANAELSTVEATATLRDELGKVRVQLDTRLDEVREELKEELEEELKDSLREELVEELKEELESALDEVEEATSNLRRAFDSIG